MPAMKIAAAVAVLLVAGTAHAHFKLVAPPTNIQQSEPYGDPQKTAPCGGAGTATNMVTTVQTGSTLTVTINETITHPGHYRVALAQTAAQLPPDPAITQVGNDQCGMAAIQNPPVFPVLADNMLPHNGSLGGTNQSFDVQLPAGMECQNCVLQVIQYMRNHGAPCFYYHCATVNITNSAPPPVDAGPTGGGNTPDAGPGGGGGDGSSEVDGGCAAAGGGVSLGALLVGALAFARRRRS